MTYGLKYQCEFDPIGPPSVTPIYRVEILQKNYSGDAINVTGAGIAAVQQWETDDPKAPIKGSSLAVTLINNGSLPLRSFVSTEDDEFKVIFYHYNNKKFEGFLVQDDFSEPLLDFTHEINLSANDNLGLLKDVPLNESNVFIPKYSAPSEPVAADQFTGTILVSGTVAAQAVAGDLLTISGGTPIDGSYLITGVVNGMPTGSITVVAPLPANYIGVANLNISQRPSLLNKTSLLSILQMCLSVTGIEISTYIFANVYATIGIVTETTSLSADAATNYIIFLLNKRNFRVGQTFTVANSLSNNGTFTITALDPSTFFTGATVAETVVDESNTQNVDITYSKRLWCLDTLIDPGTFLKNDTDYDDCYTVLTKILGRFNMTLFQANGVWNIVRWDELRKNNNAVPAYIFDSNFLYVGIGAMDAIITAGPGENTKPETGIIQKIIRSFLFDRETFNYKQPGQLLRNFNLQQVGALLKTYTTGSGVNLHTINEYEATWWDPSTLLISVVGDYFIRVTTDSLGNEIDRVMVVNGDTKSYPIEANQGDIFKFSFSLKTEDSQPGTVGLVMIVELFDGTTRNFLHEDTGWEVGVGYVYDIPTGDNSNVYHSVTVDSSQFPIPYDGLLYCYLRVADLSAPINETYYKDIRLEYIPLINESTKIIGHTHTDRQSKTIKQKEDVEIFIDASPRNSIAGTLFLNQLNGVLQQRTTLWETDFVSGKRLGEITTFEQLFWRRISRTVLEGTLYRLVNTNHLSMITIFKYNTMPLLNFVFGRMEIDYKNDKVSGDMWEIWEDNEVDGDLDEFYEFKYLYAVK